MYFCFVRQPVQPNARVMPSIEQQFFRNLREKLYVCMYSYNIMCVCVCVIISIKVTIFYLNLITFAYMNDFERVPSPHVCIRDRCIFLIECISIVTRAN